MSMTISAGVGAAGKAEGWVCLLGLSLFQYGEIQKKKKDIVCCSFLTSVIEPILLSREVCSK